VGGTEAVSPKLGTPFNVYVYVYLNFQLKMCLKDSLKSSPYLTENTLRHPLNTLRKY